MIEEQPLSFEEAFNVLEQTVRDLESGILSIEEAVKLYEQGMEMARLCSCKLDAAQLRINLLTKSEDGELETEELDLE